MSEEQLEKAARAIEKSIKGALLDKGMTQKDLAKLVHTTPQQLNMAIKGDASSNARELRKQIAEILHIKKE